MKVLPQAPQAAFSQEVIAFSHAKLPPLENGKDGLALNFRLSHGEVCEIDAADPEAGRLLLHALAGLVKPVSGSCIFCGRICRTGDYRDMLKSKRYIGYVARDAALISNLTIRDNLLLMRYFHENTLNITLHSQVVDWSRAMGLMEKMEKKPADLNAMDLRAALIVREISKYPVLFLIDRPEDDITQDQFDILISIFQSLSATQVPIVYLSSGQGAIRSLVTHTLQIRHGEVEKIPFTKITGSDGS